MVTPSGWGSRKNARARKPMRQPVENLWLLGANCCQSAAALTQGGESMALTRRALLEHIGTGGGVGAAYMAMETLGLAIPTPAGAENFPLPAATGNGRSVVILGAGIAGLVSAYELKRAGYRVTVLEARDRIGGRSWTIRGGDRIVQTGRPDQIAAFRPGLYFNAGPARIPSTHRVDPRLCAQVRRWRSKHSSTSTATRAGTSAARSSPNGGWSTTCAATSPSCSPRRSTAHALDRQVPKDELAMVRAVPRPLRAARRQGQLCADRVIGLCGRWRRLCPGAGPLAAAGASRIWRRRRRSSCRTCSSISGTCSRPCSSPSAAWIGLPMRSTTR